MSKAFTKESDAHDQDDLGDGDATALPQLAPLPPGGKNYITRPGYQRLRGELMELMDNERPKIVESVHWAAKNGDRSENGDYLYGKKRLREIDRRIRFLGKRLEIAEVTDASLHYGKDQIFFGATVTYCIADEADGTPHQLTILGIDEADSTQQQVSWISPIARSLLKMRVGDEVSVVTPLGVQILNVLRVDYPQPDAA